MENSISFWSCLAEVRMRENCFKFMQEDCGLLPSTKNRNTETYETRETYWNGPDKMYRWYCRIGLLLRYLGLLLSYFFSAIRSTPSWNSASDKLNFSVSFPV